MTTKIFEPEITAFMCIYCGYMAADTASALRIEYPANVKLIKLPCTGKADTKYILKAFEDGADGVYIIACPKGNCHHVRGNERGELRVEYTKKILDSIGLGGERLNMYFISGGQGTAEAKVTAFEAVGVPVADTPGEIPALVANRRA